MNTEMTHTLIPHRIMLAMKGHPFTEEEKKNGVFADCVTYALLYERKSPRYTEFIEKYTDLRKNRKEGWFAKFFGKR